MVRFAILIPAAEGKQSGGNPYAPDMFDYRTSNTFNYFSELNPERRALIDGVQAQVERGEGLEALFEVQGDALDEAVVANRALYESPLMAAIDRYSPGVMYRAMEFGTLPTGAQRRLLENGVIFSGMFGLLRPDDLIPNYRLRMDATLDGVGKVARYWRPHLSPLLNGVLAGKVVWDLLPSAHAEAWEPDGSAQRTIRVRFCREADGEVRPLTHGIKELRGALVNHIVTTLIDRAEALEDWEAPGGYELDFERSELDGTGGGTAVMVLRPGWEARRETRRLVRAEAALPRRVEEDEDEE